MKRQSAGRLHERMFTRKRFKSSRKFELFLRGRACVEKRRKDGTFIEQTPWTKNTITSDGFDEFLRLIAGTSAQHLDATDACVRIDNSATAVGGEVFTQVGTDVGPTGGVNTKSAPAYTMQWEWHDISADTYSDANYLHFWFEDPAGTASDYRIASVNIAAGNKPSDENWLYKFMFELYSTDTDFDATGLQLLMNLYGGNSAAHLDASGIRLRPTAGAGTGAEVSGTDQAPDGAPSINTTDDEITWTWTVADGDFEGAWVGTKIKVGATFVDNLRWGGCKTDGSSCGTKGSGEEWEYNYTIGISQGA